MAIDDKDSPDEIEDEIEGQDAGLDDNEGGNEAEAGQESPDAEGEEGQVDARPSRATRAVQEAKQAAKEAREEAAAFKRELEVLRAERAQRENTPKGESPEDEAARLALMTTDERTDYKLAKAERAHAFQLNVMRFQSADIQDKANYTAKASTDARYKKHQREVEELLAQERRTGRDLPRETILDFIIGRNIRLNGGATRDRARAEGAARIRSQEARADSGRSDRAAPRRNESGNTLRDLEKRLENVPI